MIFIIILILAAVSVIMSVWSLRHLRKMEEIHSVKKELTLGKVIYQNDSSSFSGE